MIENMNRVSLLGVVSVLPYGQLDAAGEYKWVRFEMATTDRRPDRVSGGFSVSKETHPVVVFVPILKKVAMKGLVMGGLVMVEGAKRGREVVLDSYKASLTLLYDTTPSEGQPASEARA